MYVNYGGMGPLGACASNSVTLTTVTGNKRASNVTSNVNNGSMKLSYLFHLAFFGGIKLCSIIFTVGTEYVPPSKSSIIWQTEHSLYTVNWSPFMVCTSIFFSV